MKIQGKSAEADGLRREGENVFNISLPGSTCIFSRGVFID